MTGLREQLIEAKAANLWREFTTTTDNPDDWPSWGELVAQGHQGRSRVSDFRKIAEMDLREEKKIK